MSKKITFILMKTKDKNLGTLYAMIYDGKKVISRTSLGVKVPYNDWIKGANRIKKNNLNANEINKLIDEKIENFNIENLELSDGDDNQCAIEYMRLNLDTGKLTNPTLKKYNNILKNFQKVIYKNLGMQSLPFKKLRDLKFIQILKSEIRKSNRNPGKFKTNASWKCYMSVFSHYISHWNENSGTQFPINTNPLTSNIGKNPKKIVNTLTHKEIKLIEDYNPFGYKSGETKLLSKSLFLFQYNTGGIRIQDALLLTNKSIKEKGIEIKIKKSERVELFPFNYEQVTALKNYYPNEYHTANTKVKLGDLSLNTSTIEILNRIEGLDNLNEMNTTDVQELIQKIVNLSKNNFELKQLIEPLYEVEEIIKEELTLTFFRMIKKLPTQFLFPKLNWEEFKSSYNNKQDEWERLNEKQEYLIHKAKASHNSNLRRISNHLNITKITGHSPRHTLANHLLQAKIPIQTIQKILVHSNINTTLIYLNERHHTEEVSSTLKETTKQFRSLRLKEKNRGY